MILRVLAAALLLAYHSGCAPAVFTSYREDARLYAEPPRDAITFWGHACAYIDVGGVGIVTDPVFEARYSIFHKRLIPSPPFEAYDQASVVLISHAHQDHLNPETLARFAPHTTVLCPAPAAAKARESGREVRVMRPGDEFRVGEVAIVAVAAHHPGGRLSLKARADGGALGYVVRAPALTIYYSGDTDYFPGIAEVGERYRPDIALLNVNLHLPADDAFRAAISLGMPLVIPMHSGAYGGPHAGRDARFREEVVEYLGRFAAPLRVGESLPLAGRGRGDQKTSDIPMKNPLDPASPRA
jgi:L-ascorbate metabolism protein UlaG (beta-lactamase superfamily)